MSVLSSARTMFVVLDEADNVVLICGGADAQRVCEDWQERGYRVVASDDVGDHAA